MAAGITYYTTLNRLVLKLKAMATGYFRSMKIFALTIMMCLFMAGCSACISDRSGAPGHTFAPLKIYDNNPWYWEYKGEPVLLLGGSYEDNMFQYPNWYYGHSDPDLSVGMSDWTLEEHLDKLVEVGGNYIRGGLSCRNHGNRYPYKKISGIPGDNYLKEDVYDLDQWDDEYWHRLTTFLEMCHERGIIVQIEFFDRFDYHRAEALAAGPLRNGNKNAGWEDHPLNPDRNINYTRESSGLPGGALESGYAHEMWYCVPAFLGHEKAPEPIVLETLQKWVDKVLAKTLPYDNVLYVIENETHQPLEFGEYWVDYISEKAKEAGKTVYVTNMVGVYDPDHPRQQEVRRRAKYSFYDYSQNNHNTGQEHYDNILTVKKDIADKETETDIKSVNFIKIYGAYRFGTVQDAKERFWRGIFAGVAGVRYHRPQYGAYHVGLGLNEDAQAQIKSARMFTDKMNIFACRPDNSLLGDRNEDEAYCLAEKGEQYAVFFPRQGSVTLDLSDASAYFEKHWFDISGSHWLQSETIAGGSNIALTAPGDDMWAVLILKKAD
jgi:uncharacterized protein YceK